MKNRYNKPSGTMKLFKHSVMNLHMQYGSLTIEIFGLRNFVVNFFRQVLLTENVYSFNV